MEITNLEDLDAINNILLKDELVQYATKKVYSLNTETNSHVMMLQLINNDMFIYDEIVPFEKFMNNIYSFIQINGLSVPSNIQFKHLHVDTIETFNQKLHITKYNKKYVASQVEYITYRLNAELNEVWRKLKMPLPLTSRLINILSRYVFEWNDQIYKFNNDPIAYKNVNQKVTEYFELQKDISLIENLIKNNYPDERIQLAVFNLICEYPFITEEQSYLDIHNNRSILPKIESTYKLYNLENSKKYLNTNNQQIIM